jgi:hypothetical protein
VVAAAITALLCVVALTSGTAGAGAGGLPTPSPEAGELVRGLFWAGISAGAIAALVGILVLAYVVIVPHRGMRGGAADPERDPTVPRRAAALAAVIVLAIVAAAVAMALVTGGDAPPPAVSAEGADGAEPWLEATRPADPPSRIGVAAGIAGMAILGTVLLVRARRRQPPPPSERPPAGVAHLVDLSIDDLLLERDPRRAIVAAYARMERLLERAGAPRPAHETPYEYLRRVLAAAAAPSAAVWQLTQLFQEARFSRHAITEADRDEALDALIRIKAATTG